MIPVVDPATLEEELSLSEDERAMRLCTHVNDRFLECDSERSSSYASSGAGTTGTARGTQSRIDVWNACGARYANDYWSEYGDLRGRYGFVGAAPLVEGGPLAPAQMSGDRPVRKMTIPRTQNAIIATVQIQTAKPTRVRWDAVEGSGQTLYYIRPEAGMALKKVMDVGGIPNPGLTPDQLINPDPDKAADGPTAPLTEKQVASLARYKSDWQDIAGVVQPALLADSDIIVINDVSDSKYAQRVFDLKWDEANGEYYTVENCLYSNIFGHAAMWLQWDFQNDQLRLMNPRILQLYPDPCETNIDRFEYFGYDYVISVDAAKAAWPNLAKQIDDKLRAAIDRAGTSGAKANTPGYSYSSVYRTTDFKRRMLTIRTLWERHQPVPMTEKEAIESGAVIKETRDTYRTTDGVAYDGDKHKRADGTFWTELGVSETSQPLESGGPETVFMLSDGTEVTEESENWPKTYGIRQVQIIAELNQVVMNVRCPYLDIPFGWNRNIPEPFSPYGQGEPVRTEDVTQAINRIFTIVNAHARNYQFPMEFWPQSLLDRLTKSGVAAWSAPGRVVGVPDAQWMALVAGKTPNGFYASPPPIPAVFVNILQMLLNEHDRISGNTAVLQGESQPGVVSGKAIQSLQNSATGMMAFKGKYLEWMIERMAGLALDAICKWMSESEWRRICSDLPWPVLQETIKRISAKQWNIKSIAIAGRGANEDYEREQAIELYQGGAPTRLISRETAMERVHATNVETEVKKIDKENLAMAQAAAGITPGTPGTPGAPVQQPQRAAGPQRG